MGNRFVNPIKCVSNDLGEVDFDYRIMFKACSKIQGFKWNNSI